MQKKLSLFDRVGKRFTGASVVTLASAGVVVFAAVLTSTSTGCADDGTPEPTPDVEEPETGPCNCGGFSVEGNMVSNRYAHTALTLVDGSILIGGGNDSDGTLSTMEQYDPTTSTSTARASLPAEPRFGLALLRIGDNQVFAQFSGSDAALYDVNGDAWTVLPSARLGHNRGANVVIGGSVYLVGGASFPFVDRFDLDTETWSELPNLSYGRESHTATLLEDGRILVVGGYDSTQFVNQGVTEIYDPVAGESEEAGTLEIPRQLHAAVLLDDGRVMIAGGFGPDIALATAVTEVFDPATQTWTRVGDLPAPRVSHTLTLLDDGTVLAVGGIDPSLSAPYSDAALFFPSTGQWRALTEGLSRPRQGHAAAAVGSDVLIFGGNEAVFSEASDANREVERFSPQ